MLSWLDHPHATQVLIAISTRFAIDSLRDEATRLIDELAARHDWTREQLADRTMPTAGLEPDGTLVLDTGMRQFTLRLTDALELVLRNAAGKIVKTISGPNQSEDEEAFKHAKKQLSETKKQLKEVLQFQKMRLYEALCTQHAWPAEDWQQFLKPHPIVGRHDKAFASLGITASLELSGICVFDEGAGYEVALQSLSFVDTRGAGCRTLGAIPPVMLSECYGDMEAIAASGLGYAADWREQTGA